jgi:undecaprenyl diphosphate synthase
LPRVLGHRAGAESIRDVIRACRAWGIRYLTLFAFSTENWKRPAGEVAALMDLIVEYLDRELAELMREGVKVRIIGRPGELPPAARAKVAAAVEATRDNSHLVVAFALNYGGRRAIVEAGRQLANEAREGLLDPADITEETFAAHLDTAGLPDPDLLIRPSGELRISNFLLWEVAYTEFWFSSVLWPDFRREHLWAAVEDFRRRRRTYGALPEQKE